MAAPLEERVVEVNDPALSPDINHRLTEAVREVIGADRVMVPADRPRVSQGERPRRSPLQGISSTRMMVLGLIAVAVCVGLVIATTGNHWILAVIAFVVLAIALTAVTMGILGLASVEEYPDPGLAALLSEQGVRAPEVRFSELVREFTPMADSEHRVAATEDDPAQAQAEQQGAMTPTGGPSSAVGLGADES
jgi:hypothetical protein